MKKALAVLLGIIMLVAVLPVAFAGETVTYTQNALYQSSNDIAENTAYIIPAGITMTVPDTKTVYIPAGASLIVEAGGTLRVYGTIVVNTNGELKVDGTLVGASNVTVEENAAAVAAVKVNAIGDYLADAVTFDDAPYSVSVLASYKSYEKAGTKVAVKDVKEENVASGKTVYVQLNTPLNIQVKINEPYNSETKKEETRYDESFFTVFADKAPVTAVQGVSSINVPACCEISFSKAERDADFYRDCIIYMPSGTGYAIVGRNGESADDGIVKAKYGTNFSFRVDLDDTFDRSSLEVVCYNGYSYFGLEVPEEGYLSDKAPLTPDESGYYTIAIDGDKTIQVVGSVDNDTIGKVTGIMDIMKYIFDMISSFFKQISEFLGISI